MERAAISRIAVLGLVVAVVTAGAFGCSKKKTGEEGLEGGSGGSEFSDGSSTSGGSDGDSAMAEPERVRELGSVYFDFDSASIRDDARTTLKANGQAITGHSEWKTVTLEGHTDERGSDEYNLALGERRANAAMQYLVDLGVPRARMITVSFGEGSPAVQGNDESAWRWNRRVDFKVSRR